MRCQHFEFKKTPLSHRLLFCRLNNSLKVKKAQTFLKKLWWLCGYNKESIEFVIEEKFIFRAMFISIQHSHNIIYKRYSLPFNTQLIISVLHVILIYYSEIYTYNSVHLLFKLQEIIGFSFEFLPYLSLNCSNKIK